MSGDRAERSRIREEPGGAVDPPPHAVPATGERHAADLIESGIPDVLGGDRRRYAVALIVPDFAGLERRLKDLGRPPADRETLIRRARAEVFDNEKEEAV